MRALPVGVPGGGTAKRWLRYEARTLSCTCVHGLGAGATIGRLRALTGADDTTDRVSYHGSRTCRCGLSGITRLWYSACGPQAWSTPP